ncbi:MAG: hypothetical protein JST84_21620 [Acidobacteria bacterium]|nr:hypothetical protein [Acidobacteriota bacterium]
MTSSERERIEALAQKSVTLREMWLRERQEVLAEQLAANAEMKKRWELSDPIEIIQRKAVSEKRKEL